MCSHVELTLVNLLTTALPQPHPMPDKARSVLGEHFFSSAFYPTTDLAVGPFSDPHGPAALLRIQDVVCNNLDVQDLLNMRLVCRHIKSLAEDGRFELSKRIFDTLHMNRRLHSRIDESISLRALRRVAPFCNHFHIHLDKIIDSKCPVSRHGCTVFHVYHSVWMHIFALLGSLLTLSISAPGAPPDWHKFGAGEAMLESIRLALEEVQPGGLHRIELSPINAMGMLHFRWRAAAVECSSWTAQLLWRRLTHLTVGLHNPIAHCRTSQRRELVNSLHDFLGSFASSLKVFCFSWIGSVGPNPLLLDLCYAGHKLGSSAIRWTALDTVHLKNVLVYDGDLVALRTTRCRMLRHLEVDDEAVAAVDEPAAWYDDDSDYDFGDSISKIDSPPIFPIDIE